jgi:hypothetical protein
MRLKETLKNQNFLKNNQTIYENGADYRIID